MEYRIGKCSSCGAEYKIPASFAHDVARCKMCKGVVQLAPKAPSAPEASRPARSAGRPAEQAPAASASDSGSAQPKKKGSTLERLKAERAAEAARAKQAPASARPSQGTRPSTAPRPRTPAPGAKRTSAKPTAKAGAAALGAAPVGAARGSAARSSSGRRGAGRRPKPEKKKVPMGALVGVLAILLLAGGALIFKDTLFGSDGAETTSTLAAEASDPAALGSEDAGEARGADGVPAPGDGLDAQAPETDSGSGEEESQSAEEALPDPFAAVEKPKQPPAPDPDSIDLSTLSDFPPAPGTTDAEWDEMLEWVQVWMDPDAGAKGNRSKNNLIGRSYEAIPPILNRFKSMDFTIPLGQENGNQCQGALREICGGLNFNWKEGTDPASVVFNKKVVLAWAALWEDASSDIDRLIKILKLEPDSPEANEVRAAFGAEPVTSEEPFDEGGIDDDFEID